MDNLEANKRVLPERLPSDSLPGLGGTVLPFCFTLGNSFPISGITLGNSISTSQNPFLPTV
jgi:hypothetical protein